MRKPNFFSFLFWIKIFLSFYYNSKSRCLNKFIFVLFPLLSSKLERLWQSYTGLLGNKIDPSAELKQTL
jgi:hypothetical protein